MKLNYLNLDGIKVSLIYEKITVTEFKSEEKIIISSLKYSEHKCDSWRINVKSDTRHGK